MVEQTEQVPPPDAPVGQADGGPADHGPHFGDDGYHRMETEWSELTEAQAMVSAKDPLGNRYRTAYAIEPVRSSLQRLKQKQQLPPPKREAAGTATAEAAPRRSNLTPRLESTGAQKLGNEEPARGAVGSQTARTKFNRFVVGTGGP